MAIYKLKNTVQKYDWGTKDFIPNLLNISNEKSEPCAELWMGSHPKAPSNVLTENDSISLDKLIAKTPDVTLGPNAVKLYEKKLPFLFKVLSANRALSIQAHPNKQQAEQGLIAENNANIPLDAFHRNYRDNNHKPELIVALTPFDAMCGFRSMEEIEYLLGLLEIKQFFPNLKSGLKHFFVDYLNLNNEEIITPAFLDKVKELKCQYPKFNYTLEWVLELHNQFGNVSGIISPLFLNTIKLQPGEGIYLDAGILHAYLKGTGLEIMANSDNVLRCGLTSKHIDKAELIKVLTFAHQPPEVLNPITNGKEHTYTTPANEFELSMLEITRDITVELDVKSAEILLCLEGECKIDSQIVVKKGDSVFISADTGHFSIKGNSVLYRAKTPVRTASF